MGFGDIAAKAVAPAILAHAGSELSAICRRDPVLLRWYADRFGVSGAYTDYGEMLARAGLDAVYVATPVNLHAPQTVAALRKGLHVLVEKPMALSAAEAAAMVETAAVSNLTLGIAFYHRLFPVNRRVHEIVRSGELGELIALHGNASFPYRVSGGDPKNWRVRATQSGGGPLMDVGSHRLDIFHSLAGPAEAVAAFTEKKSIVDDVEDMATLVVRYRSGVHGTLSCLWIADPGRGDYEVWCSHGHIHVPNARGSELIVNRSAHTERMWLPTEELFDLPLITEFVDAVEGRKELALSGAAGLEIQRVIEAAYRSASEKDVIGL